MEAHFLLLVTEVSFESKRLVIMPSLKLLPPGLRGLQFIAAEWFL